MKRKKSIYLLNILLIFVFLLTSFSIYTNIVYSPLVVIGSSMYPTLKNGDFGYANNKSKNIKRGEIILFHPNNAPKEIYIKRVIALPNETFYLYSKTGDITINGEIFEQDFLAQGIKELTCQSNRKFYNADELITLGADEYFVLGDNRGVSLDSAHGIGFVKKENIVSVLSVIVATCDKQSLQDNQSALKVCSINNRHYKSIGDWKYF